MALGFGLLHVWRAAAMLLAYNAMFVLPLAGILVAALLGWRALDMAAWTRLEVVAAKVGLGVLCLARLSQLADAVRGNANDFAGLG